MGSYSFKLYAPGNFSSLPAEDGTQRSALEPGDTITFTGGGEVATVTVDDPTNGTFSEIETDQTLANPITFDGVSYSAGQQVTPSYVIEFSGSDGKTYTMVSFNFDVNNSNQVPDAVFWVGGTPPPNGTTLTVLSETNPIDADAPAYPPICFESGTLIDTERGPRQAGDLLPGDRVRTVHGHLRPIVWTCRRNLSPAQVRKNPKLAPVMIPADALGPSLPARDMLLSQNHRVLVSSRVAERMFNTPAVLVPAKSLAGMNNIHLVEHARAIAYVHILLTDHEVIGACGAFAESMLLGNEARKLIGSHGRQSVWQHLPELKFCTPTPAFPLIGHQKAQRLIARISKNERHTLEHI